MVGCRHSQPLPHLSPAPPLLHISGLGFCYTHTLHTHYTLPATHLPFTTHHTTCHCPLHYSYHLPPPPPHTALPHTHTHHHTAPRYTFALPHPPPPRYLHTAPHYHLFPPLPRPPFLPLFGTSLAIAAISPTYGACYHRAQRIRLVLAVAQRAALCTTSLSALAPAQATRSRALKKNVTNRTPPPSSTRCLIMPLGACA